MRQKLGTVVKQLASQKEVVIALITAVLLSSLTVAVFIHKNPKHPVTPNNSVTVTSTPVPQAPVNGTDATKGTDINWQKSMHATEDNANIDGTVVEEIGQNQTFDGSLKLPKGWTVQYSCDPHGTAEASRTYVATPTTSPCTLAGVTYLKLNTGTAQTLKPFSQAPLVQPLDEKALSNSPYKTLTPILFNNKVFQVMQAVTVEDAGSTNDFTLNCFDLTTYLQCPGFPTYMSTTVGPLGQGTKNIDTPVNMQAYVDVDGTYGNRGYMYMPGQSGNSYGVVCVDLLNLANCGFTSLGTSGTTYPGLGNPVLISGFVESGGKLYGHANDAHQSNQTVICYDMVTDARCSGFTASTLALTPTYNVGEHGNSYMTAGTHVLDGDRLYWIVDYSTGNSQNQAVPPATPQRNWGTVITCINLTTKGQCTGWTNSHGGRELYFTAGGAFDVYNRAERPNTLFAWKNTDGSVRAICLITGQGNGVDPKFQCYSTVDATPMASGTDGEPSDMLPAQWLLFPWIPSPNTTNVTDAEGSKTYFAFYSVADLSSTTPIAGATFCWNWKTASKCANFPTPKYWHEINSGHSGVSGYVYDGSCMWGVGYGDKIWSFNAQTGETPCRVARTKYTASLTPSDFYCDDGTHVFNWGKVRLAKTSMYDFDSFNVVVKDGTGATVLAQDNLKTTSELDLSNIPYSSNQQLSVEVVSTVFNTSPWAHNNLPFVNIIASSDDAQYCYKTKATTNCDVSSISTVSDATIVTDNDTIVKQQDSSVPLHQPANEQCYKDLKATLSSDKSRINAGDTITYNLSVLNQANVNGQGLGVVTGAKYEITFPSNFTYVSSTTGGVVSGNKVTWDNQTLNPQGTSIKSVTLRAPATVSILDNVKAGHVYAATSQTPVAVQATVTSGEDVNQSDNNASDSSVILTTTTPDPPSGGGDTTGGGDTGGGGTTPDPTEASPVISAPLFQPQATTENGTTRRVTAEPDGTPIPLTPSAIKNILPPSIAGPTETLFRGINSVIAPIPNSVAEAIPYGAIGFLVAFAIIYAYQALQEVKIRKNMKVLTERFKRTEAMRKNYIDLTSHYLNTPIATMQSTVELLLKQKELPEATASTAQQRLQRLVGHARLLLGESQALSDESSKAITSMDNQKTKSFVLSTGFLLPIVGVLAAALLANVLFIWGEKYSFNRLTLSVQSSFYVLGVFAVAVTFNSFRHQRFATQTAEKELEFEQEITTSQSNFITNTGNSLQTDVMELDQLAPAIVTIPKGKTFGNGLRSLKEALAKMAYLNALTTHQVIPSIADDTLKDLADEVIQKEQIYADERNVKLTISIEPGLTALVDLDGYRQLLSSTLNNAIKFSEAGSEVKLAITRESAKAIKITVSDQGKGIAKEKIDQLFTPFARGTDTLEFNYEGFGLDLYMDKLIAEQCGGSIAIESTEGKGTTVTITLPS